MWLPQREESWPRGEEAHVGPTPCLGGLGQVIRPAFRWQIPQALYAQEHFIFHRVFPRLNTAFKKLGPQTDDLLPLCFLPEKKKKKGRLPKRPWQCEDNVTSFM